MKTVQRTYLNSAQTRWKTQTADGTYRFFERLPNQKVVRLKYRDCVATHSPTPSSAEERRQQHQEISLPKQKSVCKSRQDEQEFAKVHDNIVVTRKMIKMCDAIRTHFRGLDLGCQLDSGIPVIGCGGFGIVLSAGPNRCVKVGDFDSTHVLENENSVLRQFWRANKSSARVIRRYGSFKLSALDANAIILERVGPNVHDWCQVQSPSFAARGALCIDMILAVQEVHSANIVHNDINPRNFCVHINNPRAVKIIDFGLAETCVFPSQSTHDSEAKVGRGLYANGTMPYLSLRALQGYRYYSFCDDLEALIYCIWHVLFPESFWWQKLITQKIDVLLRYVHKVHTHKKTPDLIKRMVVISRSLPSCTGYTPQIYQDLIAALRQAIDLKTTS